MGFLLNQKRTNKKVLVLEEESESERVEDEKGSSRPASTKRLPQCVCSILSISKAGPPAQ